LIDNSVIRVPCQQIPLMWENIKFVTSSACEVDPAHSQEYFNDLLYFLLCDKAQCWIRMDKDRKMTMLWITRVLFDKVRCRRFLLIEAVYSWKVTDSEAWISLFNLMKEFAMKEMCDRLVVESSIDRVIQIASGLGFKEGPKTFIFDLSE